MQRVICTLVVVPLLFICLFLAFFAPKLVVADDRDKLSHLLENAGHLTQLKFQYEKLLKESRQEDAEFDQRTKDLEEVSSGRVLPMLEFLRSEELRPRDCEIIQPFYESDTAEESELGDLSPMELWQLDVLLLVRTYHRLVQNKSVLQMIRTWKEHRDYIWTPKDAADAKRADEDLSYLKEKFGAAASRCGFLRVYRKFIDDQWPVKVAEWWESFIDEERYDEIFGGNAPHPWDHRYVRTPYEEIESEAVSAQLVNQWGDGLSESVGERLASYPGRLFTRTTRNVLGNLFKSAIQVPIFFGHLAGTLGALKAKDKRARDKHLVAATGAILASPVHVPKFLNRTASSVGGAVKELRNALGPETERIQLCTESVGEQRAREEPRDDGNILKRGADIVVGELGIHLELYIDGRESDAYDNDVDDADEQGVKDHMHCVNGYLLAGESESLVVEKLRYFHRGKRDYPYAWYWGNCGDMAKGVAAKLGVTFPDLSNFGIGAEFCRSGMGSYLFSPKYRPQLEKDVEEANRHGALVERLIFEVERGEGLSFPVYSYFRHRLADLGDELRLQLVLSAARGQDPFSRALVVEQVKFDFINWAGSAIINSRSVRNPDGKLDRIVLPQPQYEDLILPMLVELEGEPLIWIETHFSTVHNDVAGLYWDSRT